ncbi:MAG: tRNA1(Val) (adenine(37)-N6)-methyltransferase [Bacteroidaceae bacterium]|nr:tRNA1(Val) (adenine(37)-N6)-methyltransferase [Bacteroidaceae bacterium]
MSNSYFQFKQFTINQEGCAMKVGTDGCLLGGWFDCSNSRRILDIGCGSGLIAIMAAQRCNAHVTGIEIEENAARQASANVNTCPWSDRIEIVNCDILQYSPIEPFDTIVCNPPYFVNSLKCDEQSRTMARHSDTLDCGSFFKKASTLLTGNGKISIVIPTDILEEWKDSAALCGFCPSRVTFIKTTPRKEPKRVLVEFSRTLRCDTITATLVLEDSPGVYSKEAQEILRDFYLKIM